MCWLAGAAGLLLLTGALPVADALEVAARVWPILVFLVGITVVAELADGAGVFSAAARLAARAGRGSVRRLFLLVALLATVTTVVLSLDSTAVLLTPVVLVLAAQLGLAPLPFALLTVWLANTASLLLPVSNLTNLLAAPGLRADGVAFTPLLAGAAAATVLATTVVLGLRFRRSLAGRYLPPTAVAVPDPLLFRFAVAVCGVAGVLFAAGLNPAAVGVAAAVLLVAATAWRARHLLRPRLLPWRLVLTTVSLFLVVQGALDLGLIDLLTSLAGTGSGALDLLRLTATGGLTSNAVNNLPAYLALEPIAGTPERVAALLVGTNAGPLITPWASLATLLWWDRCRSAGVVVPVRSFVLLGLAGVPVVLLAGVGGLLLTR